MLTRMDKKSGALGRFQRRCPGRVDLFGSAVVSCQHLMERELIHWLRQRLPPHPLLRLGPGDDAAVLQMAGADECVVTVDLLTDHVDFELAEIDPRRVGRKALAVNLSDLAAMAAKPLAGVIALALPRQGGMELAVALYEGMLPLAERYELAIAGGDTNSWDGPLAISITLLGAVAGRGPLCRGGARPGDRILVTGSFGGSILGPAPGLRAARPRGPGPARALRTARRHRRERRPVARPGPASWKRAVAGRCCWPRPCRLPTTPAGWPSGWPMARRRWITPWATARISS